MTTRLGLLASGFDPWHPGYIYAMRQAVLSGRCAAILAALHVDPSVERPEKRRPAMTVEERREILLACRWVKLVEVYDTEDELSQLIWAFRPALRIVGEDAHRKRITGVFPRIPVFYALRRAGWSGTEFARRTSEAYADWQRRQSCPTT